jgi:hypothetical protein
LEKLQDIFWGGGAGVLTQGLALARQVLFYLNVPLATTPTLFFFFGFVIFKIR